MTYGPCCVADQYCRAAANYEGVNKQRLPKCFVCDHAVCIKCSSRRKYLRYGIVRMCNNCQTEFDGDSFLVIKRIAKMSGYNNSVAINIAKDWCNQNE